MALGVLVLARPTPGDDRFYSRWEEVGRHTLEPAETVILVVDHHTILTAESLKQYPKLKFVVSATTGHTHLRFDPVETGVGIVSLYGETAFLRGVKSVSEFVMRLILQWARPTDGKIGRTLCGQTIGVVGMGRIGKHVSVLASSFGMRVFHVDKDSPSWAWDALFSKSDFVTVHLPEEEATKLLIGYGLMEKMKPTACLINTARPSVLDEAALAVLIRERRIAGAALDVTDRDWSDLGDRVLVTPHVAGFTLEDRIRTDEFVLQKLKGYLGPRLVGSRI